MGSSGKPQAPNFAVFDNYIQEPAYLTGMIAGGMTKTNKIGMVGGYPIPEVNRLMHAFMAGAKEMNPKVEFMVTFIGSWFDPPKAKEAAFAMIEKGADVMYAERFGVSDAAKERGKLAIGNVIDTQAQYPDTVVVSALWNMEPTIDTALKKVKGGTFKAEDYGQYSPMKFKGSEMSQLRHVRGQGAEGPAGEGRGEGEGHPRRQVQGAGRRDRAEVDGEVTRTVARRLFEPSFPRKRESSVVERKPLGPRLRGDDECARMSPVLRLTGITKRFGPLVANDAISLELARGEVLALLGENGAGKSTLVSILFGHYVPDEGTIEAFGEPLPPGRSGGGARGGHRHGPPAFHAGRQPVGAGQRDARHRTAVAAVVAAARGARATRRDRRALRPARRSGCARRPRCRSASGSASRS